MTDIGKPGKLWKLENRNTIYMICYHALSSLIMNLGYIAFEHEKTLKIITKTRKYEIVLFPSFFVFLYFRAFVTNKVCLVFPRLMRSKGRIPAYPGSTL